MDIDNLTTKLQGLGIDIAPGTIRRWAHEGLIASPPRYAKQAKKGRGGPSNWSEKDLQEIAAVWSVRYLDSEHAVHSKSHIERARTLAQRFYAHPYAFALGDLRFNVSCEGSTRKTKIDMVFDEKAYEFPSPDARVSRTCEDKLKYLRQSYACPPHLENEKEIREGLMQIFLDNLFRSMCEHVNRDPLDNAMDSLTSFYRSIETSEIPQKYVLQRSLDSLISYRDQLAVREAQFIEELYNFLNYLSSIYIDPIVQIWIIAREKAGRGWSIQTPAKVVFEWHRINAAGEATQAPEYTLHEIKIEESERDELCKEVRNIAPAQSTEEAVAE